MYTIVIGSLACLYCAGWIVVGHTRGLLLDNFLQLIGRDHEKFRPMLVAYWLGLIIALTVTLAGLW